MLQAAIQDCGSFAPFSFEQDGLGASKVDVSRGEAAQALVIASMIVATIKGLMLMLHQPSSTPRFLVVLNDYCFVDGGASRLAIGEAVLLAESGVRVVFLGAIGPVCPTLRDAPLEVICLDQLELMDVARNPSVALQGLWNLAAYRRTKNLLREMDPSQTIVHLSIASAKP
jgi:hypothetical protein